MFFFPSPPSFFFGYCATNSGRSSWVTNSGLAKYDAEEEEGRDWRSGGKRRERLIAYTRESMHLQ